MAITFLNEGGEEDYIQYLDIQGTKVEPYPGKAEVSESETTGTIAGIRKQLMQKREPHDRSQRAFVSWVQAYCKTLPADIFDIRKVDWQEVGRAWGLLRWPKMPELKRYFPQAVSDRTFGLEVDPSFDVETLKYADKVRENKRQTMIDAIARGERPALPNRTGGARAELMRRTEKAWSDKKDVKALREARREQKEVRRKAEKSKKMSEAEKLEKMELEELIARVREKNAVEDESFEGFGD